MRPLRFIFLGLALSACVSNIPQVDKPIVIEKKQGYCLRGEALYKGKIERVELCAETIVGCKKAEQMAIRFGSLANLNKIDHCKAK